MTVASGRANDRSAAAAPASVRSSSSSPGWPLNTTRPWRLSATDCSPQENPKWSSGSPWPTNCSSASTQKHAMRVPNTLMQLDSSDSRSPVASLREATPSPTRGEGKEDSARCNRGYTMHIPTMLRAFCDAVEQRNGKAFSELFTEDGVYHDVCYGAFAGRANIAEMIDDWFYRTATDFRWDIHAPVSDGHTLYTRYTFSYRSTLPEAKGARAMFEGVAIMTLRDGKIASYHEVANTAPGFVDMNFAPERIARIFAKQGAALKARPEMAKGLAKSAATATRVNGVSDTPSTMSRTSLIHSRRGPSEPMWPAIGRVVHLPFMPSLGSVGFGMSAGCGTSQFGGDQTLPGAFSVLRNNWQEARAMLVPPEKNSASTTLMRSPSRMILVLTSIAAMLRSRNTSTVSRARTHSSTPCHSPI